MAVVYAVQRRGWAMAPYSDEPTCQDWELEQRGVPVAWFASESDATRHAVELSRAARAETNPFQFENQSLARLTSLGEAALTERVVALGLPSPSEEPWRDWVVWYDDLASQLSDAQRDGIWGALDQLVLYGVVTVEVDEDTIPP